MRNLVAEEIIVVAGGLQVVTTDLPGGGKQVNVDNGNGTTTETVYDASGKIVEKTICTAGSAKGSAGPISGEKSGGSCTTTYPDGGTSSKGVPKLMAEYWNHEN